MEIESINISRRWAIIYRDELGRIFRGCIYPTKEDAQSYTLDTGQQKIAIVTVKDWEACKRGGWELVIGEGL